MSTHEPIHDPFDPFEGDLSFGTFVAQTERELCHSRPIANDLNRHLTDLLGPCPVTADGHWVCLVVSEDSPEGEVVFAQLPVHEALRLSTALANIALEVDVHDIRQSLPASRKYEVRLLPYHAADASVSSRVIGFGSRFHRKGA